MQNPDIIREVVEEMSLCRQNPPAYAEKVERCLRKFKGNEYIKPGKPILITEEGASAVHDCISFLRGASPAPALSLSDGLSRACKDLCDDHGPSGTTGHVGTDGSTLDSRIEKYGNWMGQIGENISYGKKRADKIVIQLLVDDGVYGRGHRNNIMNPNFNLAGVWLGSHATYGFMCVIDYAGSFDEGNGNSPSSSAPARNNKDLPEEEEMDPDCASLETSVRTVIKNGVKTVTTTKTYIMRDGSQRVKTTVQQSNA